MNYTIADVPEDFPGHGPTYVVSGAQPKVLIRWTEEGYEGEKNVARLEAFIMCDDLAPQLASLCRRKAEERRSQSDAVSGVFRGLLQKRWCTPAQAVWTMHRTVALLGWPESVLDQVTAPTPGIDLTEEQVRKLLRLDEAPAGTPRRPLSLVEKALERNGRH